MVSTKENHLRPCPLGNYDESSSLDINNVSESSHFDYSVISWTSPLQWETENLAKQQNSQIQELSPQNGTLLIETTATSTTTRALEADPLFTSPFYLSMTIMSCLGNLAIISVICSVKRFRKPVNLLIVNLSISSLLLMVSINIRYMEFQMDLWEYTNLWCRVLAVLHRIPVPMVAQTTMMISLDRGRAARNPLTRTNMNPALRIAFIWTFSVIIAIPLGFSRIHDRCINNFYKCSKTLLLNNTIVTLGYGSVFLLSVYLIPSLILIQESIKTLRKISFLKASNISAAWSVGEIFPTLPDTRLRLLRNSCIFSFIFLVVWLPFGICQFLLDSPKEMLPDILVAYMNFYLKCMKNVSYIQIMINPVILFVLSYDFAKYYDRFKCPAFL